MRSSATQILTCLFCALVSTWEYLILSLRTCADCTARMSAIAAGRDDVPYVYRQLTPKILVALGNTPQVIGAFQFLMLFIFFSLLWVWVRRWNGQPVAALGLVTVALVIMWPTYYFSLYTITEWVLWLSGLVLVTRFLLPSGRTTAK